MAEVEVDRKTGTVRVTKMTVAVDAGQIVNPRGIEAQIYGATVYAASRALKEQVPFDKSKVTIQDWVSYPILRFMDITDIEIVLLDQPGRERQHVNPGIGEPPNTVPPAAIPTPALTRRA